MDNDLIIHENTRKYKMTGKRKKLRANEDLYVILTYPETLLHRYQMFSILACFRMPPFPENGLQKSLPELFTAQRAQVCGRYIEHRKASGTAFLFIRKTALA